MRAFCVALLLVGSAFADSAPFAYQNNGFSTISLANSPLISPTTGFHEPNTTLQFGMSGLSGSGAISFTLSLDGKTQTEAFNYSYPGPCTVLDGFSIASNLYHAQNATLTIDLNGQVSSYAFSVVDPVPEPGTLALVGGGVFLLAKKMRRKFLTTK